MSQKALAPVSQDDILLDDDDLTNSLKSAMDEIAHAPVSLREAVNKTVTPLQRPSATVSTVDMKRNSLIAQQIAIEQASPAHKANLLSDYFKAMLKQSETQLSELRAAKQVDVQTSRDKTESQIARMQDEIATLDNQKQRLTKVIDETRVEGKQLIAAIEAAAQTQIEAQLKIVSSFKSSLIPFERDSESRS